MKASVKPTVISRPLIGTPGSREHILMLGDVEVRVQMSAYTPEEIAEYVELYLRTGITTPRHDNRGWNGHLYAPPVRATVPEERAAIIGPIPYSGLYFED